MRMVLAALAIIATPIGLAYAQAGGGGPMERLKAADANHDGNITKAEATAARETAFRALDTDGDGFITTAERDAVKQKAGRKGGERKGGERGGGLSGGGGDTDGDGKISRAEFMAAPYRGFTRFDTNHNDILEASELEAARGQFEARKKGTP